ncbi:MAG TPA: transporter substrate-binding domain-containing protein [Candidatus Binatia bacterium]|jgi:polar amino acid transport system substrate-binding protein
MRIIEGAAGLILALALGGLLSGPADAAPAKQLRVATREIPPFVYQENGRLTGFSVELWQAIAEEMRLGGTLVEHSTVKDLLEAVKAGKADLGISAISITAERSTEFDFSQPMFDAGLQIMVRDQPGGTSAGETLRLLLSFAFLPFVGLTLLFILVPAHFVWWSERRHPRGMIENHAYFPGIFEACWWAASTLATQADQMPRSAFGRAIAVLWMFTSVVFVAYFTASVTSSLTVQQLQGDIKGPEDLPGKQVATTTGSTSALYLRQQNVQVMEFPKIEQAYEALSSGQADAVVFDSPVLLYYSAHQGKGKVTLVGPIFRRESYGIVFPQNSPYRLHVNNALLTLKENGGYQRIYDKWFSSRP